MEKNQGGSESTWPYQHRQIAKWAQVISSVDNIVWFTVLEYKTQWSVIVPTTVVT